MTTSNIRSRRRTGNAQPPRRSRVSEQPPPEITIIYGDHRIELTAADLAMPDCIDQLAQQLREYSGSFRFVFRDLLGLPDDVRYRLFALMHELKGRYQIEMQVDGHAISVPSLFDAALALIVPTDDVARLERVRRASIEAISLEHADAIQMAASRVASRFKAAGVKGVLPQSIVKDVRSILGGGTTSDKQLTAEAAAKLVLQTMINPDDEESYEDDQINEQVTLRYFEGEFYKYDGRRWLQIPELAFRAIIAKLLQDTGNGSQVTFRFVTDVLANLKGMVFLGSVGAPLPLWIDADQEPSPSPYLAFQNGMLHLAEAMEGHEAFYLKDWRHFSTSILPYDYDTDATCPLWEETIYGILLPVDFNDGREDNRISVLQEFFGYLLLINNSRFEKFLTLVGDGANGKSTVTNVIISLLGPENVSHVAIDHMGGEFRLPQMAGKMANIVADMNRLERVEEGLVKNLVSGDPIQVNRKNLPPVTMYPTAKLIFGTNHLPPIGDRSNGMPRRMIVIPFLQRFNEHDCDRDRATRLKDELPGIFNWAWLGALRLLQQGHFTHCDVCARALDEHRVHSDSIAQFIEECIEECPNVSEPSTYYSCESVYTAYTEWCRANGRKAVNSSEFGRWLTKNTNATRERSGSIPREYRYRGIKLTATGARHLRNSRP